MAFAAIAAAIAPTIIGALANQGSGASDQSYSTNKRLLPISAQEQGAGQGVYDIFKQLQGFNQAGAGTQDVRQGYTAQNDLAEMLRQLSQQGVQPSQNDFQSAQAQLAPQYEALRQSKQDALNQFRETAATTGRGPLDFAFQNKLNQNFQNQNLMLGAQQSQLAYQNSLQRLGFAQDFAGIKQGLATQAMQNRLAIAGLGQQIQNAGQNFRLGAAGSFGTQTGQTGTQQSNLLTGGLAGLGTGLSLYNKFSGSKAS